MKTDKKVYRPLAFTMIIQYFVVLSISVFGLFGLIYIPLKFKSEFADYFALIAALFFFLEGTISFCFLLKHKIVIDKTEIYVPADHKGIFLRRLQYETKIVYSEINGLRLTKSSHNSNGESVFGVFVNMPYLVFTCATTKEKAINLYFYTRKQVVKMINDISERAIANGNELYVKPGEEMLQNFLQEYKKK